MTTINGSALVILGDQLFPPAFYVKFKALPVFMAEDVALATHFKYHKHKIAFFFISMREYADKLKENNFEVSYHHLDERSFFDRLKEFSKKYKLKKLLMAEIQDKFFEKEMKHFAEKNNFDLEFLNSPMFLCPRLEFKKYLADYPKPFMKTFYERERKRLEILLTKNLGPEGGQWSFDVENRKKPPRVLSNKKPPACKVSKHFEEVCNLVNSTFSSHPGELKDFWLPTTRADALRYLQHFVDYHLQDFGQYQDAITSRDPFLYHALLTPMMNNGLLTPKEILLKVLKSYQENKKLPLSSVEGFVRQVMGWREFVRGIYQNFSEEQEHSNFFQHTRKLTKEWYEGTTGIIPLDDAIKKARSYGYCHHIERLMIISNLMLLCEIHPHEVHRWFMEMFVDSADWVMGPNVYGMGQFSDGGIFATKPYISGSNYILKMSDYKKGEWSEIWDGLFWRFVGKNADYLAKNYRLNMMVKTFEKMEVKKKKHLLECADRFIKEFSIA